MIKKTIIALLLLMCMAAMTVARAQEKCNYIYEVSYSNCDKITIGNKKADFGMKFNETSQIRWAKDIKEVQCLKVWNCPKRCYELVIFNNKRGRVTIVSERETSTEAVLEDNIPLVFDTLFYLLDTLKIPTFSDHSDKVVNKVVAYIGKERVESKISRSKDGTAFIIPRTVLGKNDKSPCYIDILEKDVEKDWEYYVWRKLYVNPLPLKIE